MRVGILTFHRSTSYGAFLQVYALCRYLQRIGHDVKVIDYNPAHRDDKVRPWSRRLGGLSPQNLVNAYKHRVFTRHTEQYLPLTERSYRTIDELRQDPPPLDAYICGSDQVWNPVHTGGAFDPAYFAAFGPPPVLRIAYAPSIGSAELSPEFHQPLRANTDHLAFLSAREQSACSLISGITGRDCTHVVDPTLLNPDYSEITSQGSIPQKPYALAFSLGSSSLFREAIRYVRQALRWRVIHVGSHFKVWQYDGGVRFCSPGDWLTLMANASAIVTDSFHGTAFSLLFRKPFVSTSLSPGHQPRSVRLTDLLSAVGLSQRFIPDSDGLSRVGLLTEEPDWSDVGRRLSAMVQTSEAYLSGSLSG